MKVLLDEMLPAAVAELLPEEDVTTARAAGYGGLSNGELIRRATDDGFDVLLTADRNLPAQQNIEASGLGLVLIRGSRMIDILPQTAQLKAALGRVTKGAVIRIE